MSDLLHDLVVHPLRVGPVIIDGLGLEGGFFFCAFPPHVPQGLDGLHKLVRVRQEHVPDDFQMLVPILLDFGNRGTAMVSIGVQGPLTETELPLLPAKPERVVFNPYESVLAETHTEDWE